MKLLKCKYTKNFGHDFYFSILTTKRWSLLQLSISVFDFIAGLFYFSIVVADKVVIQIHIQILKFCVTLNIGGENWHGYRH